MNGTLVTQAPARDALDLSPGRVRALVDSMIDTARRHDDHCRYSVVAGVEAGAALAGSSRERDYRGAEMVVVPGLSPWLVILIPMISDTPAPGDGPSSYYGDLRTGAVCTALPPRA